jgi:hypothetical protein
MNELTDWVRCKVDPAYFAQTRFKALFPVIYPFQEKILRSRARNIQLNMTRQGTKTTLASMIAYHTCMFPDNLLRPPQVYIISQSVEQAKLAIKKIKEFIALLPPSEQRNMDAKAQSIEFKNGSLIKALPGSAVRGVSATIVIEDEATQVADIVHYQSLRPTMINTKGRHIMMSTPFGKRGHFYDIWKSQDPAWERFSMTAYECPLLDPKDVDYEKRHMSDAAFRSEFMCEFVDTELQLFLEEDIDAAFNAGRESPHCEAFTFTTLGYGERVQRIWSAAVNSECPRFDFGIE